MSKESETPNDAVDQAAEEKKAPPPNASKKSVNKGGLIILVLIGSSLAWYLGADRFTPCTSQARVTGYVVGVAPKVAGVVMEVGVSNNQHVVTGQLLLQIDTSYYKIALAQAESNLGNTRNQVAASIAGVESARADLRSAQANEIKESKNANRLQRLYEKDPGTISVRRLEVSIATLEAAKASVEAAEAAVERAIRNTGGLDEANNSLLKAAESAVAKARLDLENTKVYATTSGLISDLRTEAGLFAGTGAPVLTLLSMNDVWISAEFSENNLGHMKKETKVEILFDTLPGKIFKGKVRSIGRGVGSDSSNPLGSLPAIQNNRDWLRQSQRFPVIIEFDPKQSEDLWKQLRIGGQTTVIAYTEGHPILNALGKLYIRICSLFTYAY